VRFPLRRTGAEGGPLLVYLRLARQQTLEVSDGPIEYNIPGPACQRGRFSTQDGACLASECVPDHLLPSQRSLWPARPSGADGIIVCKKMEAS
jgi:hypothetical protein